MDLNEANRILRECSIGGQLVERTSEEEIEHQRHLRRIKRKNR